MIRLVGEDASWLLSYVEKVIECWHCKGGIVFKHVVPNQCPKCKANQPDAENLIAEDRRLVEKSKLIYYKSGRLEDVDNYDFR